MPLFRYQAFNADQQLVDGQIAADTVARAIAQLEGQGLLIQSIGYASHEAPATTNLQPQPPSAHEPPRNAELPAPVCREQAALRSFLSLAIPQAQTITPAIRAYANEMPSSRRRRQLTDVCNTIEQGDIAGAEEAFVALPEYWIPVLSASASARDPGRALHTFLQESRVSRQSRHQWWLVFVYPLLVAGLATVVLIALSYFVVPVFRNIFDDFGLQLPDLTKLLLWISAQITSGRLLMYVLMAMAVIALLFTLHRIFPDGWIGWVIDRIRWPFVRSTAVARSASFLADLLEADLTIPDALRIAGYTAGTARLRRDSWRLANELEVGSRLTVPHRTVLSPIVELALRAEMSAKSRVRVLREVGICYLERARRRLSWTRGIVEPLTITVVGLLVGVSVIALFMPLVKLVEGLSH